MPSSAVIRTEVRGFDLCLEDSIVALTSDGRPIAVMSLGADDVAQLQFEMAKAQLPEWNQIEELKSRAESRYRRYLGSWLVMCGAAFSAYMGYPSYILCLLLAALSIFLWWRAGYADQVSERQAQSLRREYRPDWSYLRERQEESDTGTP
jgi:hypothetical protein